MIDFNVVEIELKKNIDIIPGFILPIIRKGLELIEERYKIIK